VTSAYPQSCNCSSAESWKDARKFSLRLKGDARGIMFRPNLVLRGALTIPKAREHSASGPGIGHGARQWMLLLHIEVPFFLMTIVH